MDGKFNPQFHRLIVEINFGNILIIEFFDFDWLQYPLIVANFKIYFHILTIKDYKKLN